METKVIVDDVTGVAEARRAAARMAEWVGLPEKWHGEVALVVSEAASNIVKYAKRGEIVLRPTAHSGAAASLEMLALDKGPGIRNIDEAMRDGHSTGGSLGAGLGTMQRRASFFDLYSLPEHGTAVLAQFSAGRADMTVTGPQPVPGATAKIPLGGLPLTGYLVGARSTPRAGQDMCGDAWAVLQRDGALWVAVLDGLGHGPLAHQASHQGIDHLRASIAYDMPETLAQQLHVALKGTRGSVVGLAKIVATESRLHYVGIGNILAGVFTPDRVTRLLSTDGTVGYMLNRIRPTQAEWKSGSAAGAGSVYIASTDGLSTRWNLSAHPGLLSHHPSLIAAVLHRDFARDNDDATVVVVKGI